MPAIRVGVSSRMSNARPAPWAPGMKAGTTAAPRVIATNTRRQHTRQVATTYRLLAELEEDRDVDHGAAGRGEPGGSDVRRVRVSRGERGRHQPPPPRPSRAASHLGDRGAAAQHQRVLAGLRSARSRRWVETSTAAPRARASAITSSVASTPSGSTPSNGSSSSSTCGLVEGGQHDRQPAAHAVAEPGGHPVRDVAEVEALEQVAGALLPAVEPAQPGRELEVLPRGRPRDQAADVGAVAGEPLDGERCRCGRRGRRRAPCPRSAG